MEGYTDLSDVDPDTGCLGDFLEGGMVPMPSSDSEDSYFYGKNGNIGGNKGRKNKPLQDRTSNFQPHSLV